MTSSFRIPNVWIRSSSRVLNLPMDQPKCATVIPTFSSSSSNGIAAHAGGILNQRQSARVGISWPRPTPQQWRWSPWKGQSDRKNQERALRGALKRHLRKLNDFCHAVKAESIADLQEILCSMVLSECVYKSPASDMMSYINKFKSDFGGQFVSIEQVQSSLDHVPHRYLLAEAGDTIYASFIGTKQYKEPSDHAGKETKIDENLGKPIQAKRK